MYVPIFVCLWLYELEAQHFNSPGTGECSAWLHSVFGCVTVSVCLCSYVCVCVCVFVRDTQRGYMNLKHGTLAGEDNESLWKKQTVIRVCPRGRRLTRRRCRHPRCHLHQNKQTDRMLESTTHMSSLCASSTWVFEEVYSQTAFILAPQGALIVIMCHYIFSFSPMPVLQYSL